VRLDYFSAIGGSSLTDTDADPYADLTSWNSNITSVSERALFSHSDIMGGSTWCRRSLARCGGQFGYPDAGGVLDAMNQLIPPETRPTTNTVETH